MDSNWIKIALGAVVLAFALVVAILAVAGVVRALRRRRLGSSPQSGWMTDEMVRQIIKVGALTDRQVPEEALDLEQIAKEEERFWSETWDEPDRYWD